MPRNAPDNEMVTQGQEVKPFVYLPGVQNASGDQSGVSDTAGRGASAVQPAYNIRDTNIRNSPTDYMKTDPENYDHTDRSAKWQNREQEIPEAGKNQYQ